MKRDEPAVRANWEWGIVFRQEVQYQDSMSLAVHGKIYKVEEVKQITERFRKREFVVEVEDGRYPQTVLFQLTGDRCEVLDEFSVDDEVNISFNLRGREWTSPKGEVKFFNSLDVWKMEKHAERTSVESAKMASGTPSNTAAPATDAPPLPNEPPGWLEQDLPY